MDVEKIKLIVKNMESLVTILKKELEQVPDETDDDLVVTPMEENYDEVYVE